MNVLEKLAALPKESRAEALSGLSDVEIYELLYSWRGFMARAEQLSPPPLPFMAKAPWRTWLLILKMAVRNQAVSW